MSGNFSIGELTKAQRQALLALSDKLGWQNSGINKMTLISLARRGLVRFGYDSSKRLHVESLTPNGYEIAKKLKKDVKK